ncbi:MAG TPA: hypothetical protein VHJ78_03405 [Actinomycetota bacterium]|nr:hypothetical protein [Actinomycetota bacterium]
MGRKLGLTGPQSLTLEEMVAIIGNVIGRALRYEEIPLEALKQGMVQRGFSEPFVEDLKGRYARGSGSRRPSPARRKRSSAAPHAAQRMLLCAAAGRADSKPRCGSSGSWSGDLGVGGRNSTRVGATSPKVAECNHRPCEILANAGRCCQ